VVFAAAGAVGEHLSDLAPALAFLLAGVPLAALLDTLGYFDEVADVLGRRRPDTPVLALWALAAVTTIVLNLDTTIVLLTPLHLSLARRAHTDPLPLVAIPLLLASLSSSVLPVSNLTNLIAVEHLDLSVGDVVTHLALPSFVATTVGWLVYRTRHPVTVHLDVAGTADRRVLTIGSVVVGFVLIGFVLGPSLDIAPWVVATVADLGLMVVVRRVPWRDVPIGTAAGVAAVAALLALIVPADALAGIMGVDSPIALIGVTGLAAAAANAVNNLPALLVALPAASADSWAMWAWLLGVNVGAVLLPFGALANLLWWRFLRAEGEHPTLRSYVASTVPVAAPALAAAAITLAVERAAGLSA